MSAPASRHSLHIEVLTRAIAQIPRSDRKRLLIRADGAGASHGLLDWLTGLDSRRGRSVEYSVGFAITETVRDAIKLVPKKAWSAVLDADGEIREHADVTEITGLLGLTTWPAGMRVIVRREHPHPGAQLSLFEHSDGWRYQAFATNTTTGQPSFLEARHRAHARVEDRIRVAKDSGLGRFPSREYKINTAWLALVAMAADLTAWLRLLALTRGPEIVRAQGAALPVPARPGPPHQRRPTQAAAPAGVLALGRRRGHHLHQRDGDPGPNLTSASRP